SGLVERNPYADYTGEPARKARTWLRRVLRSQIMPKQKHETLQRVPIDYEAIPDKKQDWYSVPRDVADYMFLVGANTWRILSFTLDATNYTNQKEPKRITLDEFRFGRRKRDRSRLRAGTSASEPTILTSIREGIASDTLYVEADGHDQGRIQKRYAVIA